ncbi:MAG: response regulator [Methanoregula sp.]|nr:response regulator [Methanoregula sp.]
MNEPPPDEKEIENVIDVFILSSDESTALQLMGDLAQKDYRVTVFSTSTQLTEALCLGKPNLLICDSTTEPSEGFEVCRQIKADKDLWVIPVLILTSATNLRDLLNTLDSNADNFISQPYYLPYFLLLVEGMLATPVERQTPDQIKTQFKISHDERTYVVAANRRKLLEYLLSAFEIAVNKSSELSQVNSELQSLLESIKELESSVTRHTHVIEILNATIQQKEQKIAALVREFEEQEEALAQKNDEIEHLQKEHDRDKALITSRDETIRAMVRDQEEEHAATCSKIVAFTSRVSSLEEESEALKANLGALQNSLDEETQQRAMQEKALRDLSVEYEQQRYALSAAKDQAAEAEQEIVAAMQAKTRSEQDLTRIITDLNETAKQQAAELICLKDEIDALNRQAGELQEELSASAAALVNESGILKLQKEQSDKILAERDSAKSQLDLVLQELKEAQEAVAAGEQKRISLASNLGEVIAEKERSEQYQKSLSAALDKAKSEIEYESGQRRTAEEILERTTRERDEALAMLRHENDTIQTDLDSHKMTLAGRERDLEETIAIRETLEKELSVLKARNRALEEELNLAAQYRTQSGQQSQTLSDELEQAKAALDTERRLRRISEEKTKAAAQQQEDLERHLRTTREEMERAKKDRESTFLRFKEELETASHQIISLEEKISALEREKDIPRQEIPMARPEVRSENVHLALVQEPQLPAPVRKETQALTVETPPVLHPSPAPEKDLAPGGISRDIPRVFSGEIPEVPDISGADSIFLEHQPEAKNMGAASGAAPIRETAGEYPGRELSAEKSSGTPICEDDEEELSAGDEVLTEKGETEELSECGEEEASEESSDEYQEPVPAGGFSFNRNQWMDLLKWAHHSGALSQDQRLKIVRMGRLVQKDRKLTQKQQDQISEIIAFVYALGYRPK